MQRDIIGELVSDNIIIQNEKSGSRLYNRGFYGSPRSGGGLQLELIEGFYLLDNDKIHILKNGRTIKLEEFLTYITKREPTFEIKYIVYRDLRQRGYIVKPSNVSDFVIYNTSGNSTGKNKRLKNRLIKYWSMAVSERTPFKIKEIRELIKTSKSTRKDLIIALVDEEGDLTYYIASTESPKGKTRSKPSKHKLTGSAVLIEDRVMLWDSELIKELREIGFYGKEVGSSLQLALTEAVYLMELDVLEIRLARTRRKLSVDRFMHIAKKIQPDFDRRLMVYRELKSRHLIVKTGFKYGAHFRVYEGDPEIDHSEYLVHGIPSDFECSWEEISRAVRLAQGVRKLMLFGYIPNVGKKLEYINIERVKP